jgi:hypothetical protein
LASERPRYWRETSRLGLNAWQHQHSAERNQPSGEVNVTDAKRENFPDSQIKNRRHRQNGAE